MRLSRPVRWLLFILIVVLISSFISPVRGAVMFVLSPVITVTRHGGEGILNSFATIGSIPRLAKDNAALRATLNEKESLHITNAELAHENELLRKELQLLPESERNVIAAQVVSRSAAVTQQSFIVNKGSDDGFTKGMGIIAQGYFIGRVIEIWPKTSRIELISSSQSLIPVVLQSSRSVGLMRGGAEGLVMEDIPRDIAIGLNEAIVTANIGDVVKSGIPVGTVAAVLSTKSDVFQSLRIHSPVDISRLEIVFGVK